MASIGDLLKYKTEVKLVHPQTKKVLQTVWVKIMGDEAVKEAYKFGRIASSKMRKELQDTSSSDYELHIKSLEEQEDTDLYDLIVAAKVNEFSQQSVAVIARDELPKIEEIAVEPDAPTLPEQEELDREEEKVSEEFLRKINEYVNARKEELEATLKKTSRKKILEMAQEEMKNVVPMQVFMAELENQKGYRGTFTDKECKTKAFSSIEDFTDAHADIKTQILEAYHKLEMGPDDIKN